MYGQALSSVHQSVVHCPQSSNTSSETAGPIKAKFHMEPQWDGGTKVCSNGWGHLIKMADMPIYGKNPSKIFSKTSRPINLV